MELKTINNEAKEYSTALLRVANLAIVLWIVLNAVACWFFLISAFALIFAILRRLGCSSCYCCKTCNMGFGKLADFFFGNGYMSGVNLSRTLKIIFF